MRIRSAALVSLACVLLAESAVTADTKQIKVGVVADLTGSAGAYGTVQKNAYQLASDDMAAGLIKTGGPQISFDIQDAASDPAQVVTLVQKFTSDGSALMIGPTLSGEAKKADPIAVRANLTILATSNTAAGITAQGPCVFRDSLAEEQVVPQAIAKIQSKWHPKTAAIIYGDDNQFTKTDYDIFASALKSQNIDVVDVETYHTGDVDFKAQLTKIAEKKARPLSRRLARRRGDENPRAGQADRAQIPYRRRQRAQLAEAHKPRGSGGRERRDRCRILCR